MTFKLPDEATRKRIAQKIIKKMQRKEQWVQKAASFLTSKSEEDLDKLFPIFEKHRNKNRRCRLESVVLGAFETVGKVYRGKRESFSACKFTYKNYAAELFVGQGSFITFNKIKRKK